MQKTTALVPHMATIALLGSFDLNKPSLLQQFIGVAKLIPTFKLKPEHGVEMTKEIRSLIDTIQTRNQIYAKAAIKQLESARDAFLDNHARNQNGAGSHTDQAGGRAGAGQPASA